jgi:hypothetical protein
MDGRAGLAIAGVEETSAVFCGRWNRLVSTTNWEKGRIIAEWRQALIDGGAGTPEFSDEAWSRRVGHVSSQHVGRLRRVHDRFAAARDSYPGLYWSHFQAALDWHDAEMWLEGAVQSGWSISQMRDQRWQATGGLESDQPRDEDVVAADFDEDAAADEANDGEPRGGGESQPASTGGDGADDESGFHSAEPDASLGIDFDPDAPVAALGEATEPFRPFAHLPTLPPDLAEAFESFKLAIVRHKLAGWSEVPRDDVLATLDALRALALAQS